MKNSSFFRDGLTTAIKLDTVNDRDIPQYKLCAELWCSLVEDSVSQVAAHDLATAIGKLGLYRCIESADQYAKRRLTAFYEMSALEADGLIPLWDFIVGECTANGCIDAHCKYACSDEDLRFAFACEVLLRYPKRFTVVSPSITEATKKFLDVHHEDVKYANNFSKWPGPYVLELLRECMRDLLIPKTRRGKLRMWHLIDDVFPTTTGEFSGGSAFYPRLGTCKLAAAKYGYLYTSGYFTRRADAYGYMIPAGTIIDRTYDHYISRVMAVPKDYETSRMIAPETPYMNIEACRVRELLIELTKLTGAYDEMPPEDQSLNRERAWVGSIASDAAFDEAISNIGDSPDVRWDLLAALQHYCTIDLSHASDSIVRDLFFAILPPELQGLVRHALADRMVITIDGKPQVRKISMLATSGSVLTPILESLFFLAILHAACYLAGKPAKWHDVTAYNDDLICERYEFQTVVELLEECGLTVNLKKTFSDGPFRESCGGEYVLGIDVSGYYWPRKAVALYKCKPGSVDPITLQQLVAMQHKLFRFPTARRVLEDWILSIFPRMTYSAVGTDCDDLWAMWMSDYQTLTSKHVSTSTVYAHQYHKLGKELSYLTSVGTKVHEYLTYIEFLKNGPLYRDELSRLLHVSEPRDAYKHDMCLATQRITFTKPLIRDKF